MANRRWRILHSSVFALVMALGGCRAGQSPRTSERLHPAGPYPAGPPCQLPEVPGELGIAIYRWEDQSACEILLTGDQETLAPLMPLVGGALEGFAGRRQLAIRMPNLRSLVGIENLPPLDVLMIDDAPGLEDLSPMMKGEGATRAFERLTALTLSRTGIVDVASLRGLSTLEFLELAKNPELGDIQGVRGLTRLEWLELHNVALTDLSPLAGLTSLRLFHLGKTDTKRPLSLEPLSGLERLEDLQIEALVTDLQPLAGLPGLVKLRLRESRLTSIEPLRRAPRLEELYVKVKAETPLTPLAEISTLRKLDVYFLRDSAETEPLGLQLSRRKRWRWGEGTVGSTATELSALYALRPDLAPPPRPRPTPGYREIRRKPPPAPVDRSEKTGPCEVRLENDVETSLLPLVPFVLESFAGCNGWKSLSIEMKSLRSVEGIEALPPLDYLWILAGELENVDHFTQGEQAVPAVAALRHLSISAKSLDIAGLRTLVTLKLLTIEDRGTGVVDIQHVEALHPMKRLEGLFLDADLPDLSLLAGLQTLQYLVISFSRDRDNERGQVSLRPLAAFPRLESLDLYSREATDLEVLRTLVTLENATLHIGDDLGPIPDLPRLQKLYLSSDTLTNLAPLGRAPQLQRLTMRLKQRVSLAPLADIATLRWINVRSSDEQDFFDAEEKALRKIRPDIE